MRKDIYISSVSIFNKSIYSCCVVKDDTILASKVGHFTVQRPNKCSMYASDLICLDNRKNKDELVFHYDKEESISYIKSMRTNLNISLINGGKDKEYFNVNKNLILDYIKTNFPHFSCLSYKQLESNR